MELKSIYILIVVLGILSQSTQGHVKLQTQLTRAAVKAVTWLSRQNADSVVQEHNHGLAVTALSLSGYPLDVVPNCSKSNESHSSYLQTSLIRSSFSQGDFGEMAYMLFGAKALCLKEKWNLSKQHFRMLKTKMRLYSLQYCHDMFKYAAGIISLAIHQEGIPTSVADTMIFKSYKECNSLDIESMVALALKAISLQYSGYRSTRYRAMSRFEMMAKKLSEKYGSDLVSNNIHGYSLFAQLLLESSHSASHKILLHSIQQDLVSLQQADGSFGNVMTTIHVLPVLVQTTFLDLIYTKCDVVRGHPVTTEKPTLQSLNVKYEINLIGNISFSEPSLATILPAGSTAYDGLIIASKLRKCFHFQVEKTDWGMMVKEVCGFAQLPQKGKYWSYTVNDQLPSVGLDSYVLKDGDSVTLRYGITSL